MQAQHGTTSLRKYFVNCKCNLLYSEMQWDKKGKSLDLWYVL